MIQSVPHLIPPRARAVVGLRGRNNNPRESREFAGFVFQ